MVSEGIKDQKNQGFTNISSSRGYTMFDLSKAFSQLCLERSMEKRLKYAFFFVESCRRRRRISVH